LDLTVIACKSDRARITPRSKYRKFCSMSLIWLKGRISGASNFKQLSVIRFRFYKGNPQISLIISSFNEDN
jgi:hypothetical protein